jgi:hypothetical protein
MDKSCKMDGNCHGQSWTTQFPWKEGIRPSDIHYQLCAICGEKAHAHSTVFNWAQSFNNGKETAQALCMSGIAIPLKIVP